MKRNKILLVVSILLLLALSVAATRVTDVWSIFTGPVHMHSNLTVDDNITGDFMYGEMYNYSSAVAPYTVDLVTAGEYVNLTGLVAGDLNGFTFVSESQENGGSYLLAQVSSRYKVDFTMSFEAVSAGGLYGFAITHNFDVENHRECYSRRVGTGNVGAVSVTCIIDASVGDKINIQVEDEADPVKDILVHTINLNLLRVGD